MRPLLIISIVSILTVTRVFGQIEVALYFKNLCTDSTVRMSYALYDKIQKRTIQSVDNKVNVPKAGTYRVQTFIAFGEFVHFFENDIVIKDAVKLIDTLQIQRIKFTTRGQLHDNFWSYFNCDKPCNGRETDFYQNGNKRTEGDFINGKPKWMIEFRTDGTKEFEYWYQTGADSAVRLNKYDEKGQLNEYEIKEFKKHKTITLTYDSSDRLLGRHVYRIVKETVH